jgi:subtilisin family serine protease
MNINRIIFLVSAIVLVSSFCFASAPNRGQQKSLPLDGISNVVMKSQENSSYLPDRVIVKLNSGSVSMKSANRFGIVSLDNYIQRYSVQSVERLFPGNFIDSKGRSVDMSNFYVIRYTSPIDAFKVAEEISKQAEVQYAEPWFIYKLDDVTACSVNDTYRSSQWVLNKILADSAWCISTGDTTVVIGIVDSGVQWSHPDLQANIFINSGEYGDDGLGGYKQNNGLDDDGNGMIDDYHGWDFGGANYLNPIADNNPTPTNTVITAGHGTHVAGIASAVTNNSTGVAGIGYKCKLLPVKVISDDDPNQYIIFGFEGILYSAMMGARVINLSWSGSGASQFEQEIIDTVTAHGALVVAAAGNYASAGNPVQYPASYRGVLSVAATTTTDTKSSYSEYNEFVDVSAPGDNIYSTYYSNSYAYMSGTSMATPLVAGLAALVASQFPSYTGLQIGEQLRVSSDNIDALNPSYVNLMGRGRINAYNALTFVSPSLRMVSNIISDSIGGNNNKILEANEDATITATFVNYLQPTTSSAMVTLSTSDTNIQITNGSFPIGAVGTNASVSNSSSPFQFHVNSNPPQGHVVSFILTMSDGSYSDIQRFSVIINLPFATHNVNNIEVSLTNRSRIGFLDISNTYGSGFVYSGGNQLYEGGLIIGYSSTKLVDVVRSGSSQDSDFISPQIYDLITPGIISAQDGSAMFTDAAAPVTNKIGLQVNMYSYAFASPADSNYVILRYDIKNTSGAAISNLYTGLFFDWDILGNQVDSWNYNRTTFDPNQNLGYAWNEGTPNTVYCGARAFEGSVGYRGLVNDANLITTREAKWSWLSGGTIYTDSLNDIHFTISSGPFNIADGATKMIGFALLGGKNLIEFQESADAALVKWTYIKNAVGVSDYRNNHPTVYSLKQNYPNPFNPTTTIVYDLPKVSNVSLKIYDMLGQEVMTLVNGEQQTGRYSVPIDASRLSSGVYYYRLNTGDFSDVKKLMLIR